MSLMPQGAVALVEPTISHREFLEAVEPRYALIKVHHANQLLKRGETADSWFPEETDVIVTTSIADERNAPLPLEHNGHRRGEAEIVTEFAPAFHIPADRADYTGFDDELRFEKVEDCMMGTVTLANRVADAGVDTRVIPWIKTATPAERELCYRTIEQLGLDYAAIYCNPYFNSGEGVLIDRLLDDLEMVTEETRADVGDDVDDDPVRLLTVGLQSPNVLARAPASVEAASGLIVGCDRGWRETVTPSKQSAGKMREIYANVERRVAETLPNVDLSPDRYDAAAPVDRGGDQEASDHQSPGTTTEQEP